MTTPTLRIPALNPRPIPAVQLQPPAPSRYRERDFGIGYGRSSGYASQRQYISSWNGQARFRCG